MNNDLFSEHELKLIHTAFRGILKFHEAGVMPGPDIAGEWAYTIDDLLPDLLSAVPEQAARDLLNTMNRNV
jgi:hypothetical protein